MKNKNLNTKTASHSSFSAIEPLSISERIVLSSLSIFLIGLQILYSYKVYHLLNTSIDLFRLITNTDFQILNLSFLGDFLVGIYESKLKVTSNNKILKTVAPACKKFPTYLLWFFLALTTYAFLVIPNFRIEDYLLIALIDYVLHFFIHTLSHDKNHNNWGKCKSVFCYFFNLFKNQ